MTIDWTRMETIGQLLDALTGHGVYDIAIVTDHFPKYGFTYDAESDKLSLGGASVQLGSGTPNQVARAMAADGTGGMLDSTLEEDDRLVDGVALANAVFYLIAPGRQNPGGPYDRSKGFRATVDAILGLEASVHHQVQ